MERPDTMYAHTHERRYLLFFTIHATSSLAHAQSSSVNAPGGPAATPPVRRSVKKKRAGHKTHSRCVRPHAYETRNVCICIGSRLAVEE